MAIATSPYSKIKKMKKAIITVIGFVMAIILCSHEPSANAQNKKQPFVWGFLYYSYTCQTTGKVGDRVLITQPFNYCIEETSDIELLDMALPIVKNAADNECKDRTNSHAY